MMLLAKDRIIEYKGYRFYVPKEIDARYLKAVLREDFEQRRFSRIDFRGKTVVDIGGFVGETAIWFASQGARKVYSIEAYAGLVKAMRINIIMNGLEEKIVPVHSLLSGDKKTGSMSRYPETSGKISFAGDQKPRKMNFRELVRMLPRGPKVLKCNINYLTDMSLFYNNDMKDVRALNIFDSMIIKTHIEKAKWGRAIAALNGVFKSRWDDSKGSGYIIFERRK